LQISLLCARVIIICAVLVTFMPARLSSQQSPQQAPPQGGIAAPANDPHMAEEQAAERQALGFLGYLDQGRYADSYAYTGMLIRAQVDRESFTSQIQKARAGTGALMGRYLMDVSYTTSVPGAPEGQYVVLHYQSSFANRQETIETLTLAFAKGYWRVSGYYIK
jgi:hypothetical protein